MNTLEIHNRLRAFETTRPIFLDVYAVDQLPKKKLKQERWLLVCNCCPVALKGEHWIAMFFENERLDFFDSFGFAPQDYDDAVMKFIQKQNIKDVFYTNRQLQSIDSDACGHYCILFALFRSKGESLQESITKMQVMNRDEFVKYIVTFCC